MHLPQDLTVSDDAVPEGVFSAQADPEARDEGGEFETDVRVVNVLPSEQQEQSSSSQDEGEEGQREAVTVHGLVHDLGPASRETLVLAVQELSVKNPQGALLLVWGLPGVAEAGPTQTTSKDLMRAVLKPLPTPAREGEAEAEQQQAAAGQVHTVLLGESTVEWAARVGDPTGELGGEQGLERLGAASFLLRSSSWACALLGSGGGEGEGSPLPPPPPPALPESAGLVGTQGLLLRESEQGEWRQVPAPQPKPEPREEEEDEEEEEDDDE